MVLNDKTILVTGGTGCFGHKFIEITLSHYNPQAIRILSRGEHKQARMQSQFEDDRLRFFIGNVRDRERLNKAMNEVDIVIHAAALKRIPACEYNPFEAVKTNILGTKNVIDMVLRNEVERAMFLSTDKAVNPVNLYGATKLTAEKMFIQANSYVGKRGIKLSCVRYGNVLGSTGSIVPLFRKQKKEGVVTITDKRMVRFWITQEQAVRFIIDKLQRMRGGEVFVPKLPSMKVIDLAEVIAPDAEKKIIGIRPGEKLSEVLVTKEDARHAKEFDGFFLIEPTHPYWRKKKTYENGKELSEGFRYTSKDNDEWLSKEELRSILEEI